MAEIYYTEHVIEGRNARWPYTDYDKEGIPSKPTNPGYILRGWEFDNHFYDPDQEEDSPFGPIVDEETKIYAVWDKMNLKSDANKGIEPNKISADGEENVKLYFFGETNGLPDLGISPKVFSDDDILFEYVPFSDDSVNPHQEGEGGLNPINPGLPTIPPIEFEVSPTDADVEEGEENGKRYKLVKVKPNTASVERKYQFRAKPKEDGKYAELSPSKTVIITQKFNVFVFEFVDEEDLYTVTKEIVIDENNNLVSGNNIQLKIKSEKNDEYYNTITYQNQLPSWISSQGPTRDGENNIAKYVLNVGRKTEFEVEATNNTFNQLLQTKADVLKYKQGQSNKTVTCNVKYRYTGSDNPITFVVHNKKTTTVYLEKLKMYLISNGESVEITFIVGGTGARINPGIEYSFMITLLPFYYIQANGYKINSFEYKLGSDDNWYTFKTTTDNEHYTDYKKFIYEAFNETQQDIYIKD